MKLPFDNDCLERVVLDRVQDHKDDLIAAGYTIKTSPLGYDICFNDEHNYVTKYSLLSVLNIESYELDDKVKNYLTRKTQKQRYKEYNIIPESVLNTIIKHFKYGSNYKVINSELDGNKIIIHEIDFKKYIPVNFLEDFLDTEINTESRYNIIQICGINYIKTTQLDTMFYKMVNQFKNIKIPAYIMKTYTPEQLNKAFHTKCFK